MAAVYNTHGSVCTKTKNTRITVVKTRVSLVLFSREDVIVVVRHPSGTDETRTAPIRYRRIVGIGILKLLQ